MLSRKHAADHAVDHIRIRGDAQPLRAGPGRQGVQPVAPVIKLPEGASEDDHLALLGVLNSSTACFWLKQVSHDKGNSGVDERYHRTIGWERFYEFTGTKLQEFPLPAELPPRSAAAQLDRLAQQLAATTLRRICEPPSPPATALDAARARATTRLRAADDRLQEELDWEVYRLYGLLTETEAADLLDRRPAELGRSASGRSRSCSPARSRRRGRDAVVRAARLHPDHRAARALARRLPGLVQARIDADRVDRSDIALIERPEYKRRWATEPWEKQQDAALRDWLLDRLRGPRALVRRRDGDNQPPCSPWPARRRARSRRGLRRPSPQLYARAARQADLTEVVWPS